jgi:hypothetical protein
MSSASVELREEGSLHDPNDVWAVVVDGRIVARSNNEGDALRLKTELNLCLNPHEFRSELGDYHNRRGRWRDRG